MHYGVIMDDWGEHWRRAMEEWSGGYSMRTLDDAEERKFWAGFMKDRKGWRQDEYAGPIAERMKEIIEPLHPDSILEIGPGWQFFLRSYLLQRNPVLGTQKIDKILTIKYRCDTLRRYKFHISISSVPTASDRILPVNDPGGAGEEGIR